MSAPTPPVVRRSAAPWWMVAAGVVLVAGSAVLAMQALTDLEWRIFDTFNDAPLLVSWLLVVAMPLGSGEAAIVVPAVLLALRRWEAALAAGAAGPGAWLLAQFGKSWGLRGRPVDVVEAFVPGGEATGAGFPSGHTAVAVAFAVALWPYAPRAVRPVLVAAAVAVALARMHVGVHLPLDLVGGVGIGLLIGGAVRLLITARR